MPICGRVEEFREESSTQRWKFRVTVAEGKLLSHIASVFQSSFRSGIIVREDDAQKEIVLVTQSRELRGQVRRVLSVLSQAVTIEDHADLSHALAIHRYPDIESHSYVGDLVQKAKYRQTSVEQLELADAMLGFIDAHPGFSGVSRVSCPPSSSGNRWAGLTGFLADHVSRNLNLPKVAIEGPTRRPRKQTEHLDDCSDVHGTFWVSERIQGETILVVDDLYGAGCTTNETVRVLRLAGARRVLSLAGSKTAKRCNGLSPESENWPDWIPSEAFESRDDLPFG